MTLEERITALEKENKELKEMLKKVSELAIFAYNDMKLSRNSSVEDDVTRFAKGW